jgi:thiol-disulfide isomerase/thioredoxin
LAGLAIASLALASLPSCGGKARRSESASAAAPGSDSSADAATPPLAPVEVGEILAAARAPGAQATMINVWASWCVPCREEFPDLVRLERAYRGRGLRVLLVSTDFDSVDARKFLTRQGVDFPSYFKTGDDMSFINGLNPKWSGALPATFLYDSTGRLVSFWEGRADYPKFERGALDAMKGIAPAPKENGS